MFNKIEAAIIEVLRENLEKVPKGNIISERPGSGAKLPLVHVTNVSFEVKDSGFGQSVEAKDTLLEDVFSGDGAQREFVLTEKPLRPLISVEHPPKRRRNESDYAVDYRKGVIAFRIPPAEGEDNVLVRYSKPIEVKGLKLELNYNINVWAGDEALRDEVTVGVMEALLRGESKLNESGVYLRPTRGFNMDSAEEGPKGGFGKTIECTVEAEMRVEIPYPRMEEIDLKRPERV